MGLGDSDIPDDVEAGGRGGKASAVPCSICLDAVTDNGDRSLAKLQCGHQFHLDCIGSAFNIKGAMQCPNCRQIEKGQWLYADGGRQVPEFSMDVWTHDEDLYDLSYTSLGVHWCPFTGSLARLSSSFDEGEFPSSAYHDLLGHHAIFAEHAPVPSTTRPCPYSSYFGPIHPSSSTSSGTISDGSSLNSRWINVPSVYAVPSIDAHYHNWDHSSQRTPRSSDIPRPAMHPFLIGHSSGSRAPNSITSSVLPPYPGPVGRPRDHPNIHPYLQPSSTGGPVARGSLVSGGGGRRPGSHRGLNAPSDQHPSSFYILSSGRTSGEGENPQLEHFQQQPGFPMGHVDRDSIWAPFHHHPSAGGSDTTTVRPGSFRPRHGPSQN